MSDLFLESSVFYFDVLATLQQYPLLEAAEEDPVRQNGKIDPLPGWGRGGGARLLGLDEDTGQPLPPSLPYAPVC